MDNRSWMQVVGWGAAILALVLIAYRSSQHGHVRSHERTGASHFASRNTLQCMLKRQSNRSYENSADIRSTSMLLGSNESSLFPFPKTFTSNGWSDHMYLELAADFRIRLISHESRNRDVQSMVDRFCTETVATARSLKPSSLVIHDVEIRFVETNLLATSEVMNSILVNRSKEARDNAAYIDAEMYTLDISTDGVAHIQVHSPALYPGAHRGLANALATLEQLVHQAVPVQVPLSILDWPDNHWRGLSLDVARHFIPVKLLKRQIKALAASKFDTLHLHITDSQSFPLLLDDADGLPLSQLALKGAFSRDKVYTKDDMRELVAYAQRYGIEIVPEIDMPAHALSWGSAFEDLIVRCHGVARAAQTPHNIYPLDPSNPQTYRVARAILAQVVDIFPSKYLHIGGDEVEERCWLESPALMQWATEHNLTVHGITGYFEQQVVDMVYELGKVPIVWQGIIDSRSMPPIPKRNDSGGASEQAQRGGKRRVLSEPGERPWGWAAAEGVEQKQSLAEPAIVQPWKCWGGLALRAAMSALHSGHPVVMSACWYLDYNQEWSSYLATDLTASARAAVAASSRRHLGHHGAKNSHRLQRRRASDADTGPTTATSDTSGNATEAALALLSSLTAAQRMYLEQTSLSSPEDELLALSAPSNETDATMAGPHLHGNYFLPGGEASMWLERVDCSNLECRLWPRAGAVGARLWGLGGSFESVSYYNTAENGHGIRRPAQNRRHSQGQSPRHRPQPHTQAMQLSTAQIVQLYTAYTQYRYFLENALGMAPAGLVFHYALRCEGDTTEETVRIAEPPRTPQQQAVCHSNNKRRPHGMIYSEEISSETTAYSRIQQQIRTGVEISSNSNNNNRIPDGAFRMTAQCLGIPEEVQRPLSTPRISAVQLNVADGSTGTRGQSMLSWLQTQANRGVLFVGFCELNGWQDLESYTDLFKNRPKIAYRAANAGFPYSHVMVNTQPYNLGIVSARPFTVVAEYGPPTFQRGVLHVYFPATALHVLVVHLHAHSSQQRIAEAQAIVKIIQPLLAANEKVVIMGDFNTLSRHDEAQHRDAGLADMLRRKDEPQLFTRLRKKYLNESDPAKGGIQYAPMDILLRAGMRDACVESCLPTAGSTVPMLSTQGSADSVAPVPTWSMQAADPFSRCMQEYCAATEPTNYNPEWPLKNESHPFIRLDFVLLSQSILRRAAAGHSSSSGSILGKSGISSREGTDDAVDWTARVRAGVDRSDVTEVLSDHFPVYASWEDRDSEEIELF